MSDRATGQDTGDLDAKFDASCKAIGDAIDALRAENAVLRDALEMCRWELNELASETAGQTEARKAAEAALAKVQS